MDLRPEMVGTALTGDGWQTYYVTAEGELFVHVGDTAVALDEPLALLGHYGSLELARAVAQHRLRRDRHLASDDMRVAFGDIATLIRTACPAPTWAAGRVREAPVEGSVLARSLSGLIRA